MMRTPLPSGLIILGLALLAACGDSERGGSSLASTPEAERYGGTAVIGGIVDLPTMNALATKESFVHTVQNEVLFMPVLRYDAALNPIPWLAERWDTARVGPDSLQLTFHLRRDVRWHDGRPTTADDVRFTFERVVEPATGSSLRSAFAHYGKLPEVVDPHTIRFRLRPHAELLDVWTRLAIMPAHLLRDVPAEELISNEFGTTRPVGNGPFRFVRRVPGQEWVFEANPDFPVALGGRPYLDRLVYRVIPDQTTLLTAGLSGGIDVNVSLGAAHAPQIRSSTSMELLTAPSSNLTFIAWNGRLPMFDTPEERRALSLAIDRAAIVSALLHGEGNVGRATVTPAHWSFDESTPETTLPHSQEAARALLARAGWLDRDRDGTLEDPSGRPFRFTLKAPAGSQTRIDLISVVQAQLRGLGIEVRPSVVEGNTLIQQLSGRKSPHGEIERDFEAVVMGWTDDLRKDDSSLFHSRNLNGPYQITSFSDPRADALLDTLGVIIDREQARPLWREYQALMAQKAPKTVLYYPRRLTAVSKRMQGVEVDVRGELVSVARWWIPPAERRASERH